MTKSEVLAHLHIRAYYEQALPSIKWNGKNGVALCPWHEDHTPSLSIDVQSGAFTCFGCDRKGSIFDYHMQTHGVSFRDALKELAALAGVQERTISATYDYTDEDGVLLFQAARYMPKAFSQRHPDGNGGWINDLKGVRLVPYRLPEILNADSVIIVEGEKDVETLRALGLVASCNPMGAGKWRREYNAYFKGKDVSIIPDNDEPGRKHALAVAPSLKPVAQSVKVVELPDLPEKGDVTDWLKSGKTKEDLVRLTDETAEWEEPRKNEEAQPDTEHNKSRRLRAVTVAEMLTIEFKSREAILLPWLHTQGLTMIHSPRGVGKTHVGIWTAVAVTSGGSFLRWRASKPFGVLYLDGEMPGAVLQERFALAIKSSRTEPIAPLNIITPDLQETGMPDLSTEEGQEAVEPHLADVSLVIVDNLSTLCRSGRENEGESWLPMQGWTLRLRSRGYSVISIHHDGKGGQQRGTSRKEDVLDTVIHLKRPGDYRPEEGARFEVHFEKARGIYGDDVKPFETMLVTNPDGIQEWTMKDLEESLTQRIASLLNEGIPQHEIAEMLGVAKGTVSKHKNRAKSQGLIKGEK